METQVQRSSFIPVCLVRAFFNFLWSLPYCDATSLMKVLCKVFFVLVDINSKWYKDVVWLECKVFKLFIYSFLKVVQNDIHLLTCRSSFGLGRCLCLYCQWNPPQCEVLVYCRYAVGWFGIDRVGRDQYSQADARCEVISDCWFRTHTSQFA